MFGKLLNPALEKNLRIQAISLGLQQTGIPKDQAIVLARQQVEGTPAPMPARASMEFGGFDTTTMLIVGGVVVAGGLIFFLNKKRR